MYLVPKTNDRIKRMCLQRWMCGVTIVFFCSERNQKTVNNKKN